MATKAAFKEKFGYGLGDMASSMFWKLFSYYLPFFYSNIFGLSLGHAGTLLLVTKIYDAVSDPMMGIIADRTSTRWGRYRPYLLWMSVPFAVAGILTFLSPSFDSYTLRHIYAYASYILMMTVYTAINVPYGAMLGVVTSDPQEKSVFSSYRMFFAYVGSFLAMGLFEPLLGVPLKDSASGDWTFAVSVIAAVCAVLFICCFLLTKERVGTSVSASGNVWKDIRVLLSNRPWWLLLGASIGMLLFLSIRGGAAAYYWADVLEVNPLYTCAIFLTAGEIAQMTGVLLAVPLSSRIGKKGTFVGVLCIVALLSLMIAFVPETRSGMCILMVLQVLICIAAGVASPLMWSMFADVADNTEKRYGTALTGLVFSSSSMAQKFGGAFGSALILWVLMVAGYDNASGAVQSEQAISAVKALMSYIPAAGALLGLLCLSFYSLKQESVKD